jgi:hypothetical protein
MEKLILQIPRKNYSIEIADLPEELNWKTAEKFRTEKGDSWRLTDVKEYCVNSARKGYLTKEMCLKTVDFESFNKIMV